MAVDGTNNHELAQPPPPTSPPLTSSAAPTVVQELQQQSTQQQPRKKRRRWGDATPTTTAGATTTAVSSLTAGITTTTTQMAPSAAANVVNLEDPKAKLKSMQESIKARLEAAKAAAAAAGVNSSQGRGGVPVVKGGGEAVPPPTGKRVAALQQSIQARLQAAKAKQQQQVIMGGGDAATKTEAQQQRPTKRAKHYELDLTVTGPTYSKTKQSRHSTDTSGTGANQEDSGVKEGPNVGNPYLAYLNPQMYDPHANDDDTSNLDNRLVNRQERSRKPRELKFVEPGKWQEIAQRRRDKAQKIQEAGFFSGRKASHSIHANTMGHDHTTTATTTAATTTTTEAGIYGPAAAITDSSSLAVQLSAHVLDETLPPRWDAHPDTSMPMVMEWWDVELLPSKLRKQVARAETTALNQQSKAALELNLKQSPAEADHDADNVMMDSKMPGATQHPDDSSALDGLKEQLALRSNCWEQAALFHCKTADLVQHIVPIPCPKQMAAPQAVLHLTKEELKRQRKLRRQEKQRELQDLQAAGLIPAPEPRLTLQNFIRVLGDQAFLDPSKYEQKVVAQIQARQAAHEQRNQEHKLTKEQRSAKVSTKLQQKVEKAIQSGEIHVALFFVHNMSHPYHRTKVDLNAQQWLITGGVLECPNIASCVIVEGSSQAIQKFIRLMTVRMSWTSGPDSMDDMDGDDVVMDTTTTTTTDGQAVGGEDNTTTNAVVVHHKFDPTNRCELLWQGMVLKRQFAHFSFQATETPDQCRKILRTKGLAHHWDQVMDIAMRGSKPSVALKKLAAAPFSTTKVPPNESSPDATGV